MSENLVVVVRVRAKAKMSGDDEFALKCLHLNTPNSCALLTNTPDKMGMITRVSGVATWGEASDEVVTLLRKKDKKAVTFNLHPPRKGYGRKGVKVQFKNGGGLGYRGEKINDLIKRMVD